MKKEASSEDVKTGLGVFVDKVKGVPSSIGTGLMNVKDNFEIKNTFNYAKDAGLSVYRNIKDVGTGAVGLVRNVKNDLGGVFNVWSEKIVDTKKDYQIQFSEKEKEISSRINNLTGWGKAKDIANILGTGTKDLVFGNKIDQNLRKDVDIKDFNKNLNKINEDIFRTNQTISDIYKKEDYKVLSEFKNNVYEQYILKYGEITDMDNYSEYYMKMFEELNPFQKQNLIKLEEQFIKESEDLNIKLSDKEKQLQEFINENVVGGEEQSGYDLYLKFQEEQQDKMNSNEYVGIMNDIMQIANEKVDEDFMSLGLEKISDYEGLDTLKNSVAEKLAEYKHYELGILGMTDLPYHENLATQVSYINRSMYNYQLDAIKIYADIKNTDDVKGMNEVQIRELAFKKAWDQTDQYNKDLIHSREELSNIIAQMRERKQINDSGYNLLLKTWNLLNYTSVTMKRLVDNIYDGNDELPHSVRQEMRSIVYSSEGNLSKFNSVIRHNPDAIITMVASGYGLSKVAKLSDKAFDSMINKGATLLEAKVGYGHGTFRFIGNAAKNLTASQIYGAGIDPALDVHMNEAPTSALESFNSITNVFFDMAILGSVSGYKGAAKTANQISFMFMNGQEKQAIKDFKSLMLSKHDIKLSDIEANKILQDGIDLYQNVFNPNEISELFNTPGELRNFIGNNVVNMRRDKIDSMLTDKGLGLKLTSSGDLFGLKDSDISGTINSFKTLSSLGNTTADKVKSQVLTKGLLKDIDNYKTFFTKEGFNGFKFDNEVFKSNDFQTKYLAKNSETQKTISDIQDIILGKQSSDINLLTTKINKLEELMSNAQREFKSNHKVTDTITLIDFNNPNTEIKITYSDLNDLSGASLETLLKEGKITVTNKDNKFGLKENTELVFKSEFKGYELNKALNTFIKSKGDEFNDFIDLHKSTFPSIDPRILATNFKTLVGLSNKGTSSVVKFSWLLNSNPKDNGIVNEHLKDISDLYIKLFNEFSESYGITNMGKVNGLLLNNYSKQQDKLIPLSAKEVIDAHSSQDGFLGISYGSFYDMKDINKETLGHGMYFSFGKNMFNYEGFKGKINSEQYEYASKGKVSHYMNSIGEEKVDILSRLFKKQGNDFLEVIESYDAAMKIKLEREPVYFKDGKIDFIKVNEDINRIAKSLDSSYTDKNNNVLNGLRSFIKDLVINSNPSEDAFIGLAITEITLLYLKNKKLLDNIVDNNKKENIRKVFSQIIIQEDNIDTIARQNLKNKDTDLYKTADHISKEALSRYKKRLGLKLGDNTLKLRELNKHKSDLEKAGQLNDEISLSLNNLIEGINNQNKTISSFLRKTKTDNTKVYKHLIGDKLIKWADDFTELINYDGGLKKQIKEKELEVENLLNQKSIQKELSESITKLSKKDLNVLNKYIEESKIFLGRNSNEPKDRTNLISIYNSTKEGSVLRKAINSVDAYVSTAGKKGNILDRDYIENLFNKYVDNVAPSKKEALAEKLIYKKINSFITGSPTGMSADINDKIIKYFKPDATNINNGIDLYYESKEFKKLVDATSIDSFSEGKKIGELYKYGKETLTYNQLKDKFKEIFSDIFKGYEIQIGNENITKDLVEQIFEQDNYSKFISKLQRLQLQIKPNINLQDGDIPKYIKLNGTNISTNEYPQILYSGKISKDISIEASLKMKNMINNMDVSFISMNNKEISSLGYKQLDFDTVITFKKYQNKLKKALYTKLNKSKSYKDYYENSLLQEYNDAKNMDSGMFTLNLLRKYFNTNFDGVLDYEIYPGKTTSFYISYALKASGLKPLYETGYAFVGHFGDKGSNFHFYKAPKEVLGNKKLSRLQISKISEEIYPIHYAYTEGYLKNTGLEKSPYPTFDSFVKGLNSIESSKKTEFIKEFKDKYIIRLQDMKKREPSNMSTKSIIGGEEGEKEMNVFILQTQHSIPEQIIPKEYIKFKRNGKLDDDLLKDYVIENFDSIVIKINNLETDSLSLKESLDAVKTLSKEKQIDALMNVFNDLDDGTSYATNDIIKKLTTASANIPYSEASKLVDSKAISSVKGHTFGEVDRGGSMIRYFGKHNINLADVSGNDLYKTNSHFIGANSLKLGEAASYFEPKDYVNINIGGIEYTIVGEVKGAKLKDIKEASSTLVEEHIDMTVSGSILAALRKDFSEVVEQEQKEQIDILYDKLLTALKNPTTISNAYSEIDKFINSIAIKLKDEASFGIGSSSVVMNKLKEFTTGAYSLINKPKDEGQSVFIKRSDSSLGLEEVAMSPNSPLVKTIRQDVSMIKFNKAYTDLTSEEKSIVNNNLWTAGYRYPVPSRYGIGGFKIITDDTLSEKDVVLHPMNTYSKFEGDNDGDHIFFISAFSKTGSAILSDIYSVDRVTNFLDKPLSGKELYDELTGGSNPFKNSYIIADQVEKGKITAVKEKNLLDHRLQALESKIQVGPVSATGRTAKLFIQNKDDKTKSLVRTVYDEKGNIKYIDTTIGEILNNYFPGLSNLNPEIDKKLTMKYSSLLQKTIDAASSDESFDPYWFISLIHSYKTGNLDEGDILKKAFDNRATVDLSDAQKESIGEIFSIMDKIIAPLSMGYGSLNELSIINLAAYHRHTKNGQPYFGAFEKFKNNLNSTMGSKRNLIEYVGDKSGEVMQLFNKSEDLDFILQEILLGEKYSTGFTKKIYDLISENKNYKSYGYIKTSEQEKIISDILKIFNEGKYTVSKISSIYIKKLSSLSRFKGANNKEGLAKVRKELGSKKMLDEFLSLENEKDKNGRALAIIFTYLSGESKILGYLTNPEKIDLIYKYDNEYQKRLLQFFGDLDDSRIKDYKLLSNGEQEEYFKNKNNVLIDNLNSLKEEYNQTKDKGTKELMKKIENELEQSKIELNNLKSKEAESVNISETKYINPNINDYNITLPTLNKELIELDPNDFGAILDSQLSTMKGADSFVKIRVSRFFDKYLPQYMNIYNNIRDYLNLTEVPKAMADYIRHVNEPYIINNGKGIGAIFKKSGISDINKYITVINKSIISSDEEGFFLRPNIDNIISTLKRELEGKPGEQLVIDSSKGGNLDLFKKELEDYIDTVVNPVIRTLNKIEEIYKYNIAERYKGIEGTLILDILEAHKSNGDFALKLYGFHDKEKFEKHIYETTDLGKPGFMGAINKGHIRLMMDQLFKKSDWIDTMTSFLKGFHYQMTYGTLSTLFTGNGLVTGGAQLIPNYMEVRSYMRANNVNLQEAVKAMSSYGFLSSESVIKFGTGLQKDVNENNIIDGLFTKTLNALGNKYPKENLATGLLHLTVTNPLGAGDYPIENLRKITAISQTMQDHGIKNFAELDRLVKKHGQRFLGEFRSRVNQRYAESGGGVVSSSSIYRDTIFSSFHHYVDIPGINVVMKMLSKTIGYLMGWAYHKAAVIVEKESLILSIPNQLVKGNYGLAKKHLDDWFKYNMMLGDYITNGLGLYFKFAKFDEDQNERISFNEFNRSFNNVVVSFEILLDRRISAWNTADKHGGTFGDKLKYTTYSEINNILRLVSQERFRKMVYQHYELSKIKGEQDIMSSIKFAMNSMYTGYQRFNGITAADDIYNTQQSKGSTGILLVGGLTDEEENFKELMGSKMYASFKDKGAMTKFQTRIFGGEGSDPMYSISTQIAKEIKEKLVQDENIRKLISGGILGTGEDDFNLELLLGKKGESMNEEQLNNLNEIYFKSLRNYTFQRYNTTGQKIDTSYMGKYQTQLMTSINKALKDDGTSLEELVLLKDTNPQLMIDKMIKLETEHGIPHPIMISMYLDTMKNNKGKEARKLKGENLTPQEWAAIEKDILLNNQDILNLNGDFIFDVIEQYSANKYGEELDKYVEVFGKNTGFALQDALDILNRSYIIGKVITEDTSVTKLHSKYSLAFKGIPSNEMGVSMLNDFLQGVEDLPNLDSKQKLANQAAAIMGANKALSNLLSDNDRYLEISAPARKLLANWMYKISKDSIDFDENNLMQELNKAEAGYIKRSGARFNQFPYQSSSVGRRPNFSQQFKPIRDMMPNVMNDISSNPEEYIRQKAPNYYNQAGILGFNPMKNEKMREFIKLKLQTLFQGYESRGIISQREIDKTQSQKIRLKKAKAPKKKDIKSNLKKPSKPKRTGLNPNLPLGQR